MRRASEAGARLFRNNVGQAWTGSKIDRASNHVVITDPRPFHGGLTPGSGDLIGWVPVTITPEMVGRTVAVFTSVETKSPKGRARPDQIAWAQAVASAGGLSTIARRDEDLDKILRGDLFGLQDIP